MRTCHSGQIFLELIWGVFADCVALFEGDGKVTGRRIEDSRATDFDVDKNRP
jgi:hypothetical protein